MLSSPVSLCSFPIAFGVLPGAACRAWTADISAAGMARKKGPPAQAVKQAKANVLQDSAGTAQPNATAAKPVNLTDGQAIKRALDEHVSKVTR